MNNVRGWTPLTCSSLAGDIDSVTSLLQTSDVDMNARNSVGMTALYYAVTSHHYGVADLLLLHGSNIDYRDSGGTTVLTHSVCSGDTESVKYLLSRGANRGTALMSSIAHDHLPVTQLLLEYDTGVDVQDGMGMTSLMYAVGRGSHEVVGKLLSRGANTEIRNSSGATVHDIETTVEVKNLINPLPRSIYTNKDRSRSYMDDAWSDTSVFFP